MGATTPDDEGNPVLDQAAAGQGVGEPATEVLKLTPSEWRTVLEHRSFLERADNRFQHPRRLYGAPVQIVPDDSFR
jgi:hypothetical protein